MVKKYYIRIDDNEPVDVANGVYFAIEEDSTSDSTEFYLVRKNEYERLLSRFNAFENKVTSEVQGIVDAYLQGGRTLEKTQSTYQIISQDGKNSITYQQLANAMAKIDGNHNHTSAQVKNSSALSNIGTIANATQDTINQKIDEKIKNNTDFINNFNFKKVNNAFGGYFELYYNDFFVFFRISKYVVWKKGNKTSATGWSLLINDNSEVIPDAYKHTPSSAPINLRPPARIMIETHTKGIRYTIQTNGELRYQIATELTKDTDHAREGCALWVRRDRLGA